MNGLKDTDETLMLRFQKGDNAAFTMLYERHRGRVYGYMKKRTQGLSIADELFQDVFLKLYLSRHQYLSHLPFLPWLFVICKSVWIDAVRARRFNDVQRMEPYDESRHNAGVYMVPTQAPLNDLDAASFLTEQERQLIHMRYQEDLPFDEIALRLGLTSSSVRQRLHRLLKTLRQKLMPDPKGSCQEK